MIVIESMLTLATSAGEGGSLFDPIVKMFTFDSPLEKWLLFFGFLGQSVFFGRWIVQWIATERKGESHMPEMFWWFSLVGAVMLLMYYILRLEPIGIIGQCVGWTVYARNLYLIKTKKKQSSHKPSPQESTKP